MKSKLRQKDFRAGYEKGWKDALDLARQIVSDEFDRMEKENA